MGIVDVNNVDLGDFPECGDARVTTDCKTLGAAVQRAAVRSMVARREFTAVSSHPALCWLNTQFRPGSRLGSTILS